MNEGLSVAPRCSPRILLLTDRYFPEVGGSFTWFHNVYTRHPAGTVWIVTNDYPGARALDRAYPQVHLVRTTLRRYPFLKPESLLLYAKMLLLAIGVILRHRIRVVHAGKNMPEGFVAKLLRRYLGIPYVVYAHGEEIGVASGNPRLRPHLAPIYQNAAAVIANSRYTHNLIRDFGVEDGRIAIISPGVDPGFFQPRPPNVALRKRLELEGKAVLLTVGRLQRRKGHDMVIEALPSILRAVPALAYVIAGEGEEEAALRKLAKERGVSGAVRFLGRVPQENLPDLYNLADVVIMANRSMPDGDVEGFGIVFLEAGACGKPVIAGASGGTADAVQEGVNGLRVDGTSTTEITQAVVWLARDPALRRQMGEAGRRLVAARYAWEAITEKTLRLSKAILAGGQPVPELSTSDDRMQGDGPRP